MKKTTAVVLLLLLGPALTTLPARAARAADEAAPPPTFRLPAGFSASELVAVPGARSMVLGAKGTLFVGTMRQGNVYAVREPFSATPRAVVVAKGLRMPTGVAVRDGALYVAEPDRVLRFPGIEDHLDDPGTPEVAVASLPFKNMAHAWKYIAFGPDGRLYVPVGVPCNICAEDGFGVMLRMKPDGSEREVYARGLRNSVGFAWHPVTGELWFTDNGRDMLGDDVPPDELNRAPKAGLDFGFPRCHAGRIPDPEFGKPDACRGTEPPVQALGPHVASLGVKFYTGTMFPAAYRNQVFIAEHGSWNRSPEAGKTGYRVTLVRLEGNRAVSYEPFMEGFLDGDRVLGRPVDVLVAPDGSLLVSDDQRGAIYRVTYQAGGAG